MSEIELRNVIKQLTLQDSNDWQLPNNVAKTPVVITKNGDNIIDMLVDKEKVDDSSITIDEWGRLTVKLSHGEGGAPANIAPGFFGLYVIPAYYAHGDLDLPDDTKTTVTPEKFNMLLLAVKNLIAALQNSELLEEKNY